MKTITLNVVVLNENRSEHGSSSFVPQVLNLSFGVEDDHDFNFRSMNGDCGSGDD